MIFDNDQNKNVALECKEFVRYLGIIIDNNLSWKHHIDHVAIKMSRTVGLICKLRHFLPRHTLLTIYRSLVAPYLSYGLTAWIAPWKASEASKASSSLYLFFWAKSACKSFIYWRPGGVRTTIAKHHGRFSKSDHLCQDRVEWTSHASRLRSEYSLITL